MELVPIISNILIYGFILLSFVIIVSYLSSKFFRPAFEKNSAELNSEGPVRIKYKQVSPKIQIGSSYDSRRDIEINRRQNISSSSNRNVNYNITQVENIGYRSENRNNSASQKSMNPNTSQKLRYTILNETFNTTNGQSQNFNSRFNS